MLIKEEAILQALEFISGIIELRSIELAKLELLGSLIQLSEIDTDHAEFITLFIKKGTEVKLPQDKVDHVLSHIVSEKKRVDAIIRKYSVK